MATAEGIFPKLSGDPAYDSDFTHKVGNFLTVTAGENITSGNVIYIKKSDGKAYVSDTGTADDIRASGLAVQTKTTGNAIVVQLSGPWTTSGLTANNAYYLGATGAVSTTKSGVLVGYAYSTTVLNIKIEQDDKDLVGIVKSYAKSFTGVPSNNLTAFWVECNGQALSDSESPLDGETIPDLNGDNRFIRGNATSGGTGGSATMAHTHDVVLPDGTNFTNLGAVDNVTPTTVTSGAASNTENRPPYYDMVYIIKVK